MNFTQVKRSIFFLFSFLTLSISYGLNFSSVTVSESIESSSGTSSGMNHRLVSTAAGDRYYTDIGIDPWSDPHIFQTFENWGGDNSTNWLNGNSGDGYSCIRSMVYGSPNHNIASILFSAGNGANYSWAPGVTIARSSGVMMLNNDYSVIYSQDSEMDLITEGSGQPIKFWPNKTNTFEIGQEGVVVTGFMKVTGKTLSQLSGLDSGAGYVYYCTNCTVDTLCVGTGGTGAFKSISNRTVTCR